jgi:hypothetical protein
MSHQSNGTDISLVAAADLSASQYFAVKVDSNGKAALAGAGEQAIGVVQNDPTAAQTATVRIGGVTKMKAGATIAAGARVAVDAAGKAKTAVASSVNTSDAGGATDAVVGSHVFGVALEGASDGDIFAVCITQSGGVPTTAA